MRRVSDPAQRRFGDGVAVAQVPDDVFHHHHRAFHHHSEIQRAQRQQIRRNPVHVETDGCEQQREWNGDRDDECAANISEEDKEDQRYQDHAHGEIVQDGPGGIVNQFAAVQKRDDGYPRWKNALAQLFHFLVNRDQSGVRVCALAQQNDAFDNVIVVDDPAVRAVNRVPDFAQTDFWSLRHLRNIANPQWCAALRLDDGLFYIVDTAKQPDGPHIDLLHTGFDETAAGIHIVVGQLLLHLRQIQTIRNQLVRIDANLIFPGYSSEADHVDYVRHRFELLCECPILERLQFHQVVLRIGAVQRVPIDLAHRTVIRANLRLDAIGERELG